eukprot:XP_001707001.1 Hypothetical protein GL50803_7256 [Giardia lamblia ATCC 50803]
MVGSLARQCCKQQTLVAQIASSQVQTSLSRLRPEEKMEHSINH